jgi:8-oxo-dGTP pyrophosphatase MutT (NUDIX family)
MGAPKLGKSKNGKLMHYSVGAVIKRNNKYLLIERKNPPFGFAGLAGHIDEGENEIQALFREVKEESGLTVKKYKLLFTEELDWDRCNYGVEVHYWYLFECEIAGSIKPNYAEVRSIGWYAPEKIKILKLKPVWQYWLKKLNVI